MKQEIKPATGRLGVLVVGVGGAVATTMIVGTLASGLLPSWLLCVWKTMKKNLSKM